MVKATTFNGIKLPSIAIRRLNGNIDLIREFGYEDFKERLS
jgi:carboxynorspermidine decarboxylase